MFINFYADLSNPNLEFTKIVLSNVSSGTGLESDNHTIASTYADISGKAINPLPSFNPRTNPGSNDMLSIDGANVPISGGSTIGGSGTATVPITNGGTLSDTSTTIGQNPGSNGTVVINGSGSQLNTNGDTIIGGGGNGTLNVINGGTANSTNTTIAKDTGSTGIATIDGARSQLNNSGTLDVGPAGPAADLSSLGGYS